MENNTTPSKLDETIKDSLSNYDAKYDSGDWARMERMLDAKPKSIAPKGSYNIALILAAVVLVGGFLIYKGIDSSKKQVETAIIPAETPVETVAKPTIKSAAPIAKKKVIVQPAEKLPIVVAMPEVKTKIVEIRTEPAPAVKKEKRIAEKTKKDKKQKTTIQDTDFPKNQKVTVMGNEPIFGDMIDSSKGIVRETKEKESTKKEAVKKGAGNIVLSGLMNLNADSIREQKERIKNDTLQR